jgi:CRISPR/Cas system-associated protein Csx1
MKDGLMLIERIVIESIAKKEKNIYELSIDTNLNQPLLLNILPELLMKNLIKYHRGIYSIDLQQSLMWKNTINKKINLKEEVKELFASIVNDYFNESISQNEKNSELKIQKVWLDKNEELILKNHLNSLDNFLKTIKQNHEKKSMKPKTFEQKILIWGVSNYSQLIDGILTAV